MWNGTEEEFEKILCDYKAALYGTAFTYLHSNSEIDDVVQETFIELYYKYDTIRDKSKIGAWLCGVCRNLALKRLRSTRYSLPLDYAANKTTADPASVYEKADRRRMIRMAINRLSPPVAETISLYYISELSVAAIAELLGIPQGTVKSRLYEGRRKLKGELEFMRETNIIPEKTIPETIRKILKDADYAMQHADENTAVHLLNHAILEIGESIEHYYLLAELYRKRAEAEFMNDRKQSEEDEARALAYARLTGDNALIAKYMLIDAYNEKTPEEDIRRMHEVYTFAKENGFDGICAEAAYWEGVKHIHNENESSARECLPLALEHYSKLSAKDIGTDICDGSIVRVHALADGALKALNLLRETGRNMGDWESCNTFCQILRRDGESITKHNNYGWNIPGRQFNCQSIFGVYDGQGYLFAEELLDNDTVTYEYYNFNNLLITMTYMVISRDTEITTPAGHFTGCLKVRIRENLSEADAAKPENRESIENLCEYECIYCPGVGLISNTCTYMNSTELNAEYGGSSVLTFYSLTVPSSHMIPMEEGNLFEYTHYDAVGKPLADKITYRDIYRVDTVTSDGMICLSNYGYGYYN